MTVGEKLEQTQKFVVVKIVVMTYVINVDINLTTHCYVNRYSPKKTDNDSLSDAIAL